MTAAPEGFHSPVRGGGRTEAGHPTIEADIVSAACRPVEVPVDNRKGRAHVPGSLGIALVTRRLDTPQGANHGPNAMQPIEMDPVAEVAPPRIAPAATEPRKPAHGLPRKVPQAAAGAGSQRTGIGSRNRLPPIDNGADLVEGRLENAVQPYQAGSGQGTEPV